jgi:hypothetical protein
MSEDINTIHTSHIHHWHSANRGCLEIPKLQDLWPRQTHGQDAKYASMTT